MKSCDWVAKPELSETPGVIVVRQRRDIGQVANPMAGPAGEQITVRIGTIGPGLDTRVTGRKVSE
jgi:hypothetical protein